MPRLICWQSPLDIFAYHCVLLVCVVMPPPRGACDLWLCGISCLWSVSGVGWGLRCRMSCTYILLTFELVYMKIVHVFVVRRCRFQFACARIKWGYIYVYSMYKKETQTVHNVR